MINGKVTTPLKVLLADDDLDDRLLFKEAVEELPLSIQLSTVEDGMGLMKLLSESLEALPDVLFLDLNMPRKNGSECLAEIKGHEKLKELPVVIYSTSLSEDVATLLYNAGAHYYICKPVCFNDMRAAIYRAFTLLENNVARPLREAFVFTGKLVEI